MYMDVDQYIILMFGDISHHDIQQYSDKYVRYKKYTSVREWGLDLKNDTREDDSYFLINIYTLDFLILFRFFHPQHALLKILVNISDIISKH